MRTTHILRKPVSESSIAANVLKHGTGAINIDRCRISTSDDLNGGTYSGGTQNPILGDTRSAKAAGEWGQEGRLRPDDFRQPTRRWPANLVLQHKPGCVEGVCDFGCPVADLDEQSDTGGASRFYKQVTNMDELTEYLYNLIAPTHLDDCNVLVIEDPANYDWTQHEDASIHGAILMAPEGKATEYKDEVWRILKPGAHLLVLAPEDEPTGHTGACALEDQGFEVRDAILVVTEPGRLHYVSKPSRKERHGGCANLKIVPPEGETSDEDEDDSDPDAKDPTLKGNIHPCLHPDALVMTNLGFRPISDIQPNDRVLGADGFFHAVEEVSRHPYTSPNLFEIAVAGTNYTTRASDNHPFLIWRPTRTKNGHLKGGEVLWAQASEVRRGDYTLNPLQLPQGSGVQRPDDTEFWFLFGLYLAEGVLHRANHKDHNYPSYTLHESEVALRERIAKYTPANTGVYKKKGTRAVQVIPFDKELGKLFGFYGGRGAATKRLHPAIWNLSLESRAALFEGWMAGDGGVVRTWRQGNTVSPEMASQMRVLAESIGYKANLFHYEAEPGRIGDREFKSTLPYYVLRVYEQNQKLAEEKARKPSRPTHLEHEGVKYLLRYVQSVTPVPYSGDVVNLSVHGSPTFQTAVGMSHNTVKARNIMIKLLRDVPADAVVLDPFMGSGSTGLACLKTGHDFIGIEMSPEYIQVADARIRYWDREEGAYRDDSAVIESEAPKAEDNAKPKSLMDLFGL